MAAKKRKRKRIMRNAKKNLGSLSTVDLLKELDRRDKFFKVGKYAKK